MDRFQSNRPCPAENRPAIAAKMLFLAVVVFALAPANALSEIYRYQYADGNWQFSDQPPPGHRFDTVPESYATERRPDADLEARLERLFDPQSPIARATVAVVAMEHGLGAGSGFFISADGYILTNRHVVRPADFGRWKEIVDKLAAEEMELASLTDQHDELERQLVAMEEDLKRLSDTLDLALLKLDGHRTPAIPPAAAGWLGRTDPRSKRIQSANER